MFILHADLWCLEKWQFKSKSKLMLNLIMWRRASSSPSQRHVMGLSPFPREDDLFIAFGLQTRIPLFRECDLLRLLGFKRCLCVFQVIFKRRLRVNRRLQVWRKMREFQTAFSSLHSYEVHGSLDWPGWAPRSSFALIRFQLLEQFATNWFHTLTFLKRFQLFQYVSWQTKF